MKRQFKNMPAEDLVKHFSERKQVLDNTQAEIIECKKKLEALRKREMLEYERLKTVTHWMSSRTGKQIEVKRV